MRSVSVRGGRGRTTAGTTGTAATETGGTRGTTGSGRNTEGPLTGERNLLHLYFMSRNQMRKYFVDTVREDVLTVVRDTEVNDVIGEIRI